MRVLTRKALRILSAFAMLYAASTASGHGFDVFQNQYPAPTALTINSDQPVLDNEGGPPAGQPNPKPGPYNIFTDEFSNVPSVGNGGGSYYETYEGFVDMAAGPGSYGIRSATFNILSPLYYSDGTGTSAVPASTGTYLEFSVNPETPNAVSQPLADGGPEIEITGSTSLTPGFYVTGSYYHELLKDLYIEPGSSQTYGEYGYEFDVTYVLTPPPPLAYLGSVTLTTPPMVDVFALTDSNLPNGDFGDDAPQALQDAATTLIYNAVTAPVPEPSTFVLAAFGIVTCAVVIWKVKYRIVQSRFALIAAEKGTS